MRILNLSLCLVAASTLLLPVHASAQKSQRASPTVAVVAQAGGSAAFGPPIGLEALARFRGGTEITSNDMTLNGTTASNSADHVITGTNSIGSGAFANMNGLPLVVQNSGANVLIQNAVIVNVKMN